MNPTEYRPPVYTQQRLTDLWSHCHTVTVTVNAIDMAKSIESDIAKILKQTEGIDQIKKDLKVLNELAEKNKDDHKILLEIKNELTSYKETNEKLTAEVNTNTLDIDALKTTVKRLEEENHKLKDVLKSGTATQDLTGQINQQIARNQQKYQIIIEGVPENRAEDPILTARQICTDAGVNISTPEIDSAYRLGRFNDKASLPRTILVTFIKRATRDEVYRNRMVIKQNPLCKNIWVNENLDSTQMKERAILRTVVDFAKDIGKEARMVGEQIIISGLKYTYDTLQNLPEQISLERVFTRSDDQYIYFQSEFSPYSSFAKVKFTYKGIPHTSAEQAFCYQKAKGNDFPDLAKSILVTEDPRKCKSMAAVITTTPQWLNQEKEEMAQIVTAKYQVPIFRKKMLDTGTKRFVECTKDKKWGADATLRSKAIKDKTWHGKNQLGKILDDEKARILRETENDEPQAMEPDADKETDAATPPRENVRNKKDKKKSPKERRMARRLEQARLTAGTDI